MIRLNVHTYSLSVLTPIRTRNETRNWAKSTDSMVEASQIPYRYVFSPWPSVASTFSSQESHLFYLEGNQIHYLTQYREKGELHKEGGKQVVRRRNAGLQQAHRWGERGHGVYDS